MRHCGIGGIEGWACATLAGVLGNRLVAMAAFLHSPANMADFPLAQPDGVGPGRRPAPARSIARAAVGNRAGAFFLVVLPFRALDNRHRAGTLSGA